jgi:hypothetical protein
MKNLTLITNCIFFCLILKVSYGQVTSKTDVGRLNEERLKVVAFCETMKNDNNVKNALAKLNRNLIIQQGEFIKKYSRLIVENEMQLSENQKQEYLKLRYNAAKKILKESKRSGLSEAVKLIDPKLIQDFDFDSNEFLINEESKVMAPHGINREIIYQIFKWIEENKSEIISNQKRANELTKMRAPIINWGNSGNPGQGSGGSIWDAIFALNLMAIISGYEIGWLSLI